MTATPSLISRTFTRLILRHPVLCCRHGTEQSGHSNPESREGSHMRKLANAVNLQEAESRCFNLATASAIPGFQDDEEIQEIPNPPQLPSVAEECSPQVRLSGIPLP